MKGVLRILVVTIVALASSGLGDATDSEMEVEPVRMTTNDIKPFNEALRTGARELLPTLETNRDALLNPKKWAVPWRPASIGRYKDMTFNSDLVPWEEMSYEEKLLLLGKPSQSTYSHFMYIQLAVMAYGQYQRRNTTEVDILWHPNPHLITQAKWAEYLSTLISPVTNRLIEIDHPEFSPGNAYLRIVTEDEVQELVKMEPKVDKWWEYSIISYGVSEPKDIRKAFSGREELLGNPNLFKEGAHPPFLLHFLSI